MWTALHLVVVILMFVGAWRSYKAMGKPVRIDGRRYWRHPDGLYRRWYGGRGRSAEALGLPAIADETSA